jgi:predicted protein tyrosine phosphatase
MVAAIKAGDGMKPMTTKRSSVPREIVLGSGINLIVLSRPLAEDYLPDVPHAVISIRSSDQPVARLPESPLRLGVLYLCFDDAVQQPAGAEGTLDLCDEEDARQVVEFVTSLQGRVKLLVVHCEAGLGRSAGAAAGIAKWLNDDDSYYYRFFRPNSLVRWKILEAVALLPPSPSVARG